MIAETAFAAVGLLFLLSAVRAFSSQLYHSLYLGLALPNAVVAGVAFAAFGLSLGALVLAALGPRRGVAVSAGLLVAATVLGVLVRSEWPLLAIWALGLAAGTWWLALLHGSRAGERPAALPTALPLAIVGDLLLRAMFGTVAIVDLPTAAALAVVAAGALVLAAGGIAALAGERSWSSPGPRGAIGLLALPLLVLAGETGGLNGAQVAAAGGIGLDGGPSAELGALAVGIGVAAGLLALRRPLPHRLAAAAGLAVGAAALWLRVPLVSVAGGALFAASCVVAAALLAGAPQRPARSPAVATLALGLGWIGFAAAAFAYHALYDYLPALWAATALAALAVLVSPGVASPLRRALTLGAAGLAVLVPALALLLVPSPVVVPAPTTFRLMTWNLNQGFDAGEVAGLDAIVATIAGEAPDVLVVQEVARGWLIDERHDLLSVLGARLRMRVVFGPQIGDLYGNAILTRLPVGDVVRVRYPKEPGLRYQPRGALIARIAGTTIIATHLDHNADASRVRTEQLKVLLDSWDGRAPAIVVGDLNALPGAPELDLLTARDFVDLAARSGAVEPTFPAHAPRERIDWAWGIGVTPSQAHVVASTASDHRPLVVNITPNR